MNNTSFWSAVIIVIASSFFLGFMFGKSNPKYKSTKSSAPTMVIRFKSIDFKDLSYVDTIEMEHNNLVCREKEFSAYLDQTSPVTDTLYIYNYIQ